MSAYFDTNGDLWIEVEGSSIPEIMPLGQMASFATNKEIMPGVWTAVRKINLTAYIRSLSKPAWVNAALTSSSAEISIQGGGGGKAWLDTIPDPIEPDDRA